MSTVPETLQAWRAREAGRIIRVQHNKITLIMHDQAGRWECSYPTLEATLAAIAREPDWHRSKPPTAKRHGGRTSPHGKTCRVSQ